MDPKLYESALNYHEQSKPGKISIICSKPLEGEQDLSLAYSPGVAAPVLEIAKNIENIYKYTSRGNMVGIISDGSAILGLGNLGPAAAKPVMEGKAALFKKMAGIDAIDIEIDAKSTEELISIILALRYNFGGINLEDIKAPECFVIEEKLKEILDIPVFHDDQHGTAVVVLAGLINASQITSRSLNNARIVINGAGAAGIACANLLKKIGVIEVIMCDSSGVIYEGREGNNSYKALHAIDTNFRTLSEAITGADVFIGVSAKGTLSPEMVKSMNKDPIIFALANPDPEIFPEEVKIIRNDAIIATGRSDYPNQINNALCFPYIFKAALDTRAIINDEMKIAAARSIAMLARESCVHSRPFGIDCIVPKIFDKRLIYTVPLAVACAAIESGAAKRLIDLDKYQSILYTQYCA